MGGGEYETDSSGQIGYPGTAGLDITAGLGYEGSPGEADQARQGAGPGTPPAPRWSRLALIAPPVVTLTVMLYGLTGSSYWKDETATVSAISRPFPGLWRMFGKIDAVHALYFALLWPVAHLAGTGEAAMRVPSAIAMALAARRRRDRLADALRQDRAAGRPRIRMSPRNQPLGTERPVVRHGNGRRHADELPAAARHRRPPARPARRVCRFGRAAGLPEHVRPAHPGRPCRDCRLHGPHRLERPARRARSARRTPNAAPAATACSGPGSPARSSGA